MPLSLPTVTLCAAASVNVAATIRALKTCLEKVNFAECLLFGTADIPNAGPNIRCFGEETFNSAAEYSDFLLLRLADFVNTPHCLIVQWDGFVLDASAWNPRFLDCDYIGAPWPQFSDGHDVGNGGFSLRSRRLLDACRDSRFVKGHPEDVFICRTNRAFLEREHGIRFADTELAQQFAFERIAPFGPSFGFHGIFNMIRALGADQFWEVYRTLDDRTSATIDYGLLFRQFGRGSNPVRRRLQLTFDYLKTVARR